MQSAFETPSPLWLKVLLLVATFVGGGGVARLITIYLNRRRPEADVQESQARAELTLAEARKFDSDAQSQLAAIVLRYSEKISDMQLKADQKTQQVSDLTREKDKLESELKLASLQQKKLKALLDIHEIKYSEFDEP